MDGTESAPAVGTSDASSSSKATTLPSHTVPTSVPLTVDTSLANDNMSTQQSRATENMDVQQTDGVGTVVSIADCAPPPLITQAQPQQQQTVNAFNTFGLEVKLPCGKHLVSLCFNDCGERGVCRNAFYARILKKIFLFMKRCMYDETKFKDWSQFKK